MVPVIGLIFVRDKAMLVTKVPVIQVTGPPLLGIQRLLHSGNTEAAAALALMCDQSNELVELLRVPGH